MTLEQRAREVLAGQWGTSLQFARIRRRILDGSCAIHSDGDSLASSIALSAMLAFAARARAEAIEEAAKVAETEATEDAAWLAGDEVANTIATAIRALNQPLDGTAIGEPT